jgi:hypothetical protein
MSDKKYIYVFQITQHDGTSVRWEGCQTKEQIHKVVEVELDKLE